MCVCAPHERSESEEAEEGIRYSGAGALSCRVGTRTQTEALCKSNKGSQ